MANRKRNIQMKFWVTEEEKNLIDQKRKGRLQRKLSYAWKPNAKE